MKRSMLVLGAAVAALLLLVAWRASAPDARAEEKRGEREKEREINALQGTWKFIRYEEAGGNVDDGARRAWIINGRKWAHREKDQTSPESRLEIDPEEAVHHLDVWDGETHVISAIYVRAGDVITLCANRPADSGKGRPTRFETGTPEGGLFIIVCRIEK
jgi:uncharacterized protein (TIGR03067 family)